MSKTSYQPLSEAARRLKRMWAPCVSYCCRLQDLHLEIVDLDGTDDAAKLRRERREINDALEALRASVREQITKTEDLSSLERRILRLRYLCANQWDAIAVQVGRESSAVFTAHRKALNKVAAYVEATSLKKAG